MRSTILGLFDSKIGSMELFATNTPPPGYLVCEGQAISRTTYSKLFSVIGTTWGAGDSSTTFNLPDGRGAVLRGTGTGVINGRDKVGPAVGSKQEDQMQRITGAFRARAANEHILNILFAPDGAFSPDTTSTSFQIDPSVRQSSSEAIVSRALFNSADSPDARASATTDGETRPYSIGTLVCIFTGVVE